MDVYVLSVYDSRQWHCGDKVFSTLPNPHDVAPEWFEWDTSIEIVAHKHSLDATSPSEDNERFTWDDPTGKWLNG